MPQANDAFASATTCSGSSGSVAFDNAGTDQYWEAYEPTNPFVGYHTLWYKHTPAASGLVRFQTTGITADWAYLSVYTGTQLSDLVLVAHGGVNSGGSREARITWSATAGTTYYIQLGFSNF